MSLIEDTKRIFNERIQETNDYINFLSELENHPNKSSFKTLKAACFVLLYNIIESILTNLIEAIHEAMDSNEVGFDECNETLQSELYRMLCNRRWENIKDKFTTINHDIVYKIFDKKGIFSGNIDSKIFRQKAKKYGFHPPTKVPGHDKLQIVKKKRNDLSHGVFSFEEIGRDVTVKELKDYFESVKIYVEKSIDQIENYIKNEGYLKSKKT
ncbi:MAG: hypothetical protein LBP59_03320 [Planctomycetaceae bacterium]|jgi:hypothetical protein|nr:hypothetical protein [Planctomycetaceae bacterium]